MSDDKQKTFSFEQADLLASALQAQLLQRCRRSLNHDLKNVVQGLYSGLEILSKSLNTPSPRISPRECIPLLNQQLANLQQSLGKLLDEVAPVASQPQEFDLVALLNDIVRFLSHESAISKARLQFPAQAMVVARVAVVRRALLSLILDAADTMTKPGSLAVTITQQDEAVLIELSVPASPDTSAARQKLIQLVEQTLAEENAALSSVNTDSGYAVTLRLKPQPTARVDGNPSSTSHASADAITSSPSTALRVLIVDDNRDAADSLALLLELEGHTTRAAYTGGRALELVAEFLPDLVLLDIGLPDMDGHKVVQRIRESFSHQPRLVSVSGYESGRGDARGVSRFDAELVKPVDLSALQELIVRFARSR